VQVRHAFPRISGGSFFRNAKQRALVDDSRVYALSYINRR
jgi:hypothetical protein